MAFSGYFFLGFLALVVIIRCSKVTCEEAVSVSPIDTSLNRNSFPEGFIFGAGSSSYQEDVGMMKDMNLDSYRFSISWSRILPSAREELAASAAREEGAHKRNEDAGERRTKGATTREEQRRKDDDKGTSSKDFQDYAELCFKEFGDRVKYWVTLNEPWSYNLFGYANGRMAPSRCSAWMNSNCTGGDSATSHIWLVITNFLLM
ncbi:hypothetical protein ACSQ67_022417 [Phaseolus vulgaris]